MLQDVVEDCQFPPVAGIPQLEVPFHDALLPKARTELWILTMRVPSALTFKGHLIPPQKQNKQKPERTEEYLQKQDPESDQEPAWYTG